MKRLSILSVFLTLAFTGCALFSAPDTLSGVYMAEGTQKKEPTRLVSVTLKPDKTAQLVSKDQTGSENLVLTGEWESDGEHVVTVRLSEGENHPLHRSIVFRIDENGLTPLILDRTAFGSGEVKLIKEKENLPS